MPLLPRPRPTRLELGKSAGKRVRHLPADPRNTGGGQEPAAERREHERAGGGEEVVRRGGVGGLQQVGGDRHLPSAADARPQFQDNQDSGAEPRQKRLYDRFVLLLFRVKMVRNFLRSSDTFFYILIISIHLKRTYVIYLL